MSLIKVGEKCQNNIIAVLKKESHKNKCIQRIVVQEKVRHLSPDRRRL